MAIKKLLRSTFGGVAWQHPIFNFIFKIMDPIDFCWRHALGRPHIPKYSIRVRSNGVTKQFGGKNFIAFGEQIQQYLIRYADLNTQSLTLEIGCGCGRNAYALANYLETNKYIGMDIEKVSLESCKKSAFLKERSFTFIFIDVNNDEYNPAGGSEASSYDFPFSTNTFDVVFLVSVFTHMLTDDVRNYISEIAKVLQPGGICFLTTFLMDFGRTSNNLNFPHSDQSHFFYDTEMPEVAVGYERSFFDTEFELNNCKLVHSVPGYWRNNQAIEKPSDFSQDILCYRKIN